MLNNKEKLRQKWKTKNSSKFHRLNLKKEK